MTKSLKVLYTNWRGVTAVRHILPQALQYKSTPHHQEPQWILEAFDFDKQDKRDFALNQMDFTRLNKSVDDSSLLEFYRTIKN